MLAPRRAGRPARCGSTLSEGWDGPAILGSVLVGLLIGLVVGLVLGTWVVPLARRSFRRVVVDLREVEAEEELPPIERRASRTEDEQPFQGRTWT